MLVRQRNQKGLRHQTQIHGRTWRDTALRRSIPKHDPCDQLESVRTCQKAAGYVTSVVGLIGGTNSLGFSTEKNVTENRSRRSRDNSMRKEAKKCKSTGDRRMVWINVPSKRASGLLDPSLQREMPRETNGNVTGRQQRGDSNNDHRSIPGSVTSLIEYQSIRYRRPLKPRTRGCLTQGRRCHAMNDNSCPCMETAAIKRTHK